LNSSCSSLLKDAGKIVKKEDLSRKVLERDLSPFDRSLDMHISNLRKKLGRREGDDEEERIKTIRSVGYIYTVEVESFRLSFRKKNFTYLKLKLET
jgi:two-component system response regulator CpxR